MYLLASIVKYISYYVISEEFEKHCLERQLFRKAEAETLRYVTAQEANLSMSQHIYCDDELLNTEHCTK